MEWRKGGECCDSMSQQPYVCEKVDNKEDRENIEWETKKSQRVSKTKEKFLFETLAKHKYKSKPKM